MLRITEVSDTALLVALKEEGRILEEECLASRLEKNTVALDRAGVTLSSIAVASGC